MYSPWSASTTAYLWLVTTTVFSLATQSLAVISTEVHKSRSLSYGSAGYGVPIHVRSVPRTLARRGEVSGSIGLGNAADLLYTVPVKIGETVSVLHLDTGSSDLWVASDECTAGTCESGNFEPYPSSDLHSTGTDVQMFYGDSTSGTSASGVIGRETVAVAGIAMRDQAFGLMNETTNLVILFQTSGIFGLGFPSASKIQAAMTPHENGQDLPSTDNLLAATYTDGPLLSRISMTNQLEMPMFTVTLQRNTIDIDGEGLLTVGSLPPDIDNSTLTWVPVRRYSEAEGGLAPPAFAPNEIYPQRWEIDIDAVYLDGVRIQDSNIQPSDNLNPGRTSALIDTGNSILRGPRDVVEEILSTVSSEYDPESDQPTAIFACDTPHTLAFEIGGQIFPIDPRDFIGEVEGSGARDCVADNIVPTDAPSTGSLFRWSLGAPFLRSNLVAFHYGNLTHPSLDPPRIGIRSLVPNNAEELYLQAVEDARNNNGEFEETVHIAPTDVVMTQSAHTVTSIEPQYTLSLDASPLAQNSSASSQHTLSWTSRSLLSIMSILLLHTLSYLCPWL